MKSNGKRIDWIDIFKGLAIILVVVGHATGLFNAYIYQFHVAAFFFISGWVAKLDRTSLLRDLIKKAMTLIVPLLLMIVMFGIVTNCMNKFGIYKYFWDEGSSQSVFRLMINFLQNGTMVDLLGAAWFVEVLFFTSIISHFLYVLTWKDKYIFIILTVAVYILGYYSMRHKYVLPYGADMALLAQGYYGMGFFLKSVVPEGLFEKKRKSVILDGLFFLITSCFMYLMKEKLNGLNLMNMADREINSLGWATIAVANGIIWLYSLSQIISYNSFKPLKNGLIDIGRNTMGIMLLHFSFFRLTSVLLFAFEKVEIDELKNLVPSTEVGNTFWLLYVFISVSGSLGIWKIITRIPVLRQLLGTDIKFINKFADKQGSV